LETLASDPFWCFVVSSKWLDSLWKGRTPRTRQQIGPTKRASSGEGGRLLCSFTCIFAGPVFFKYPGLETEPFLVGYLWKQTGNWVSNYSHEMKGALCWESLKDPASVHFLSQWEALGLCWLGCNHNKTTSLCVGFKNKLKWFVHINGILEQGVRKSQVKKRK
jgi:hypothetical protein